MSLGLYIHIPFCVKKCDYCDFISYANRSDSIPEYMSALTRELKSYRGKQINTIFIGGGTPTRIDVVFLERLMKDCFSLFEITSDAEISIEANPGTVSSETLIRLKQAGINRISFGVQSMQNNELTTLGRIHQAQQAVDAMAMAKVAGFENINIDLMFGIPHQTFMHFSDTLQQVVALKPQHLSVYSLIIEEDTSFFVQAQQGKLCLPDEDIDRKLYEFAVFYLMQHGYQQYEISNFALEGYECRHNIKYWQCQEYIGAGLGAHSYFEGARYSNITDLSEYIKNTNSRERIAQYNLLTSNDLESEYIIMGLRMNRGIDLKLFNSKFGYDFYEKYKKDTDKFISNGLMQIKDDRCYLTLEGISVSNSILCEYV